MNPPELVKLICGEFYVPGKRYPGNLPANVEKWYAYCSDGGHCLVCVLAQDYKEGADLKNYLVPVPVKTVMRSHEVKGGYVVVNVPYSEEIGLMAPPEDEEF